MIFHKRPKYFVKTRVKMFNSSDCNTPGAFFPLGREHKALQLVMRQPLDLTLLLTPLILSFASLFHAGQCPWFCSLHMLNMFPSPGPSLACFVHPFLLEISVLSPLAFRFAYKALSTFMTPILNPALSSLQFNPPYI